MGTHHESVITEAHRGEARIGPSYDADGRLGRQTRYLLLCPYGHVVGWTDSPELEAGRTVECRGEL